MLPDGAVKALKAYRPKAPEGTSPEALEVAAEATDALLDVMREDWRVPGAPARLAAVAMVFDRTLGPVPKPLTLAAPDGGPVRVSFVLKPAEPAPASPVLPPEDEP